MVTPAPSQRSVAALCEAVKPNYPDQLAWVEAACAAATKQAPEAVERALPACIQLAKLRLDPPAALCPMFVDIVANAQDPEAFTAHLREAHGDDLATLVDGVSRLSRMRWNKVDRTGAEQLRKMFLAMAADVRVVIVALAMRVHALRGRKDLAPEIRRTQACETLEILAPLANRLGIFQLKWELEDLALRELEPEIYRDLGKQLAATRSQRTADIESAMNLLRERLKRAGIEGTVSGRPKHIYSIYRKMQRKQVGFDQIYDVSAVRVLVHRLEDCYALLGMVHSEWTPIPGEFDDYIARPKQNGYQSLHTAVAGPGGKHLEVQIRTMQMHQFAEFGVAAHWRYKENAKKNRLADEKFNVLRQLMDWQKEVVDPEDFVESLKTDIFQDQVYVFTPGGDVLDLPLGATPVDFAYRIHTNVGHRCRGALVNGHIASLDHKLQTGDRVEILTHRKPQPSRDWLNPQQGYVQSSSARQKIRQWFRQQGRETSITQGRELLDRELRRLGIDRPRYDELAPVLKFKSADDLLAAVGFGDMSSQTAATRILDAERHASPEPAPDVLVPQKARKKAPTAASTAKGVSIGGVSDVLSHPARCCTPVPGDPVIGYISRGKGLVIHRRDCPNILSHREPERLIDVDWGTGDRAAYPVTLVFEVLDRPGTLRDISTIISDFGVNLQSVSTHRRKGDTTVVTAVIEARNNEQVIRLLHRLERLSVVIRARRQAG
ncbi:MAG: RelA/SpoT family protein [Nannocystaceae bacterium]